MPTFNIIRESKPSKTFRVASVIGKFDLPSEHIIETFNGDINIDNELIRKQKIKEYFNKEENKKNFYNTIYCYNSDNSLYKEYKSVKFASEELNISKNIDLPNNIKALESILKGV